ncbi:MAG: AAA family ATPase [Candidatus Nanohaloarchaea archaeon]
MTVIEDSAPLQRKYLPDPVIDREKEQDQLEAGIHNLQNLHIHGPRGTGKTHLTEKAIKDIDANTCHISCLKHDTQYKVLKQILQELTNEKVGTGHHTSELQRRIKKQVEVLETVLVLDELDFLLLNDGDDLLYFLSRLDADLGLVLVTANHEDLSEQLEERTFSTLQPQRIGFEPYSGEQIYEVLADRARRSLKPRSLRREALTYIASSTQNLTLALTWLQISAQQAEDTVTESLVKEVQEDAYQSHTKHQLQKLSQHHRLLYQGIEELDQDHEKIQTGKVYSRYKNLCKAYNEDSLSDRRISDYLKQLEQLNLITSQYHYGGQKGKTREITKVSAF